MAKVLRSFLIGVGLDTEQYDKGSKKVEGNLERTRSVVGIAGAAMAGAFAVVGTAAVGAGRRIDDLALVSEGLKTSPQYINDYGNALRALGGSAADAEAAIGKAESALSELRHGGTGLLPNETDLQLAGVDTVPLRKTQSGKDYMRELARQMPNLSKERQRRVQDVLGLPDAVMRSLRKGVGELDAAVARAGELYGEFGRATEAAREYNRTLGELNTRFAGIGETLAEKLLPSFTGVLQSVDGFIGSHKETTNKIIDTAAENPVTTAAAVGAGSVVAAGVASKAAGLGLAAGRALTVPGMALGAGVLLGKGILSTDWAHPEEYFRPDYSSLPDAPYGPAVPQIGADGKVLPLPDGDVSYLPLNQDNHYGGFAAPYEPIYAGGEISNAEAAEVSPDVVMIRDQRMQAERPAATPRVDVKNHLDVRLELDGRQFDKRVTEVVERRESNAMDDIISSVNR